MAVVTVIVRAPRRGNTPGKWGSEFWFFGINQEKPTPKNTRVNLNPSEPIIFEGNFDFGKPPDERAIQMAHFHAMGIISKEQTRRIMDLGGS